MGLSISADCFVVPTIPHTGTHFIRDHLLAGQEHYVQHLWPKSRVQLSQMATTYRTIVPLRHPILVARSWKSRDKDIRELPDYWYALIQYIDPHEPQYLPLDSPNRDGELACLNLRFGTSFKTDWPVMADDDSAKLARVPLTDSETEDVVEMMVAMADFFNRWYKDWPFE